MAIFRSDIRTLFIGLLLPILTRAADHEQITPSVITQVTVFLNQAQVTKVANVNLQAGVTQLIFSQSSPYININSLQVKTDERVNIVSVSTRHNFLKPEQKPDEVILLEDSLEKINDQLSRLKNKKDGLLIQKDIMLANKQLGGANAGLHADDVEDVLTLYHKKTEEIGDELYKLSKTEKLLVAIHTKLRSQLEVYARKNSSHLEIVLTIQSDIEAGNVRIEYSYFVSNASWRPFYEVRVKDAKSPLELISKAHVMQNTGEDWSDVMLKLSTSNPNESGIKPELQTTFIGFVEPVSMQAGVRYKSETVMGADVGSQHSAPAPEMVHVVQSAVNTEFNITNPYSIPSDNNPHQVDLAVKNHQALYSYESVPKTDLAVFATARIPAIDLANQIAGEANVYYSGSFIGKTYIEGTSNDTLVITLGKDNRIQVQRTLLKDFSSKSFTGSSKKDVNTWEISIKNTRKEAIELQLEDQIPVSTDKEIEVKLIDAGGATVDNVTGKLTWKVALEGEKSLRLKFSFEVKYPKDRTITPY